MADESVTSGRTRLVVHVPAHLRGYVDADTSATGKSMSAIVSAILQEHYAPMDPEESYVKCDQAQWSAIVGRIQGMADRLSSGENPAVIAGRMLEFSESLMDYRRANTVHGKKDQEDNENR
jgi:hypothetical protein